MIGLAAGQRRSPVASARVSRPEILLVVLCIIAAAVTLPSTAWSQVNAGKNSLPQGSFARNLPSGSGGPLFLNPMLFGSGATGTDGVAVADLNGDGKLDLAVSNACPPRSEFCGGGYEGYVSILLGNGDGTFQPAVTYDAGGVETQTVVVADLNGDGKLDLVVSNSIAGTVGVLLGNGDGTFQPVVTYLSGGAPEGVAVADLNGDGIPDIVVANSASCCGCQDSGWVAVLLGNGDGTFKRGVAYASGGFRAGSVVVADLSGDGILDVAVTNGSGRQSPPYIGEGSVSILLGKGDGTLGRAEQYPSRARGTAFVAIGDLNGDGKSDLILSSNNCLPTGCRALGILSILLGNGDGTSQPATTFFSAGDRPNSIVVADVNNDGKLDLVVSNGCSTSTGGCLPGDMGVVSVFLGKGDGSFQSASNFGSGGYWYASAVAVADVNGDGKPDIIVTNLEGTSKNPPEGSVGVLLNNSH